jgi:hypothetical protein
MGQQTPMDGWSDLVEDVLVGTVVGGGYCIVNKLLANGARNSFEGASGISESTAEASSLFRPRQQEIDVACRLQLCFAAATNIHILQAGNHHY